MQKEFSLAQFLYAFQIAESDEKYVQRNCINGHCNVQRQYECKENPTTFCGMITYST